MKYTAAKLSMHKYSYKSQANKADVCSTRHLPTLYMGFTIKSLIKASSRSIVSMFLC